MSTAQRLLLLACVLLAGCKPDRLAGEETIEQQLAGTSQAATGESATLSGDALLGRIGRHNVTLGDFERRVGMLPSLARTMFDTDARRAELLDLMIRLEVMALEAQRVGLAEGREEQWRVREMLLRRWLAETVAIRFDPTEVTDAAIAARFERELDIYSRPELRDARLMLLATREEAEEAHAAMLAAVDSGEGTLLNVFARWARDRSLHGATRESGGGAGRTASAAAGAMGHAPLLDLVFATPPGRMAPEPLPVDGGWLLVLVERRIDAVERTPDDYAWLLRQRIVDEQVGEAGRRELDALRAQVAPTVDAAVLASLQEARIDGGPQSPQLPRRFDAAGLADLPARYVGEAAIAELSEPREWRNNPNYAFAPAAIEEGSGTAAPGVPE